MVDPQIEHRHVSVQSPYLILYTILFLEKKLDSFLASLPKKSCRWNLTGEISMQKLR